MSHVNMTHGRRTHGMTHGNSNSGESARTCVHCELPENLVFTYTIDASERQPLLPKIVCDAHL